MTLIWIKQSKFNEINEVDTFQMVHFFRQRPPKHHLMSFYPHLKNISRTSKHMSPVPHCWTGPRDKYTRQTTVPDPKVILW